MSHKFVVSNSNKCLGCRICEFVCSATKEKRLDPAFSRIRPVNYEPIGSMAIACLLCEDPACVAACPRDALLKDEKGVIR